MLLSRSESPCVMNSESQKQSIALQNTWDIEDRHQSVDRLCGSCDYRPSHLSVVPYVTCFWIFFEEVHLLMCLEWSKRQLFKKGQIPSGKGSHSLSCYKFRPLTQLGKAAEPVSDVGHYWHLDTRSPRGVCLEPNWPSNSWPVFIAGTSWYW